MKRNKLFYAVCLAGISALMAVSLSACGNKEKQRGGGISHDEVKGISTPTVAADVTSPDGGPDNPEVTPGEETPAPVENTPTPTPEPDEPSDPSQLKIYNTCIVYKDTAYEMYNYVDAAAQRYGAVVNKAKEKFGSDVNVYDIIIPLSSEIVLPADLRDDANISDERAAMDKLFGYMNDDIIKVDIYDALYAHRKDYIYFRTDHHWTALGAWYAYDEFCKAAGKTSVPTEDFTEVRFEGFLGSFYEDCKDAAIAATPDVVIAYDPKCNNTVYVSNDLGDTSGFSWKVIADVNNRSAAAKYQTFAAADSTFVEMTNNDLTDESACIVLKESFGNAFVPFLLNHYQHVYVVDYRYYTGNLSDLIAKTGTKDVIFCNNISMTRNTYLIGKMETLIG
ncbi:MAG: hypothetical protein K5848_04290 [Lachnospiraceae bacterium]|nr:hypothetical protein [Lachnospiraceae bacterium]